MSEATPPDDLPVNPYAPPQFPLQTSFAPPQRVPYSVRLRPGLGRGGFLLSSVAIFVLGAFLSNFFPSAAKVIITLLLLLPASSRLQNIGRNPALCFLLLVPVLGLFITVPCLILPPGYQLHRTLDLGAKVVAAILIMGLLTLAVIVYQRLEAM